MLRRSDVPSAEVRRGAQSLRALFIDVACYALLSVLVMTSISVFAVRLCVALCASAHIAIQALRPEFRKISDIRRLLLRVYLHASHAAFYEARFA